MNPDAAGGGAKIPDSDLLALFFFGLFGLGAISSIAAYGRDRALAWLLEHHVLVAAAQNPLLAIPGCNGAGLDTPRLLAGAGAILMLAAWAISELRRRYALTPAGS